MKYIFFLCPAYVGSTIMCKILSTSCHCSTMMEKNNPSHAGEGNTRMMREGKWHNDSYLLSRKNKAKFPYEHCANMYHHFWDTNNPDTKILCSKDPYDVLRRWQEWHNYWDTKYGTGTNSGNTIHYICMIRDPRYYRDSIDNWLHYARYVKQAFESRLIDSRLVRYEDLTDNPTSIINEMTEWIPELGPNMCSSNNGNVVPYTAGTIVNMNNDPQRIRRYNTNIKNKQFNNMKDSDKQELLELIAYFGYDSSWLHTLNVI